MDRINKKWLCDYLGAETVCDMLSYCGSCCNSTSLIIHKDNDDELRDCIRKCPFVDSARVANVLLAGVIDSTSYKCLDVLLPHPAIIIINPHLTYSRIISSYPDDVQIYRGTFLHQAVLCKNHKAVEKLLDHGVDYLKKDTNGKRSIDLAYETCDRIKMKEIIIDPELCARLDAILKLFHAKVNDDILCAVKDGNYEKFKKLLKYVSNVNAITDRFYEARLLHEVAGDHPKRWILHLINAGANINIEDREGQTPMHYALYGNKRSVERIMFFLSLGALLNQAIFNASAYKFLSEDLKDFLEKKYVEQHAQQLHKSEIVLGHSWI